MSTLFMSPDWFFGYNILFESFFFLIAIMIAVYALKVYQKTEQPLARYFGYGFLLIAAAHFVQLISNYLTYSRLSNQLCQIANLQSTAALDALGTYAYIILMMSGIVALLFVSLKSDKQRTLWILLAVSISAIMFSKNPIYTFYLLSSIYLAFVAWHFIENYLKHKKVMTLSVALAFLFLCFGSFHFLISVNHELFYFIGYILEFIAYAMILLNWYLVKK